MLIFLRKRLSRGNFVSHNTRFSMKETLHLIALRTVRHNERNSILTAYTLERGMMSFLQPAGGGKEEPFVEILS